MLTYRHEVQVPASGGRTCSPGFTPTALYYRMDRIKARQQKYKKGKERMLSLTQESGEGQDAQKLSEEDDESTSRHFFLSQHLAAER